MELKPGHKETDVGVFPEDWEIVPLGDHFKFKNGLNKAKEYFGYGTPIVNYMDVFQNSSLRLEDIQGCVDVNTRELKAYEVRHGDVFFTRTSETVEEIGVASAMIDEPKDTVFSGFVLRARPIDKSFDSKFKGYCFASAYFRKQVTARASYTTRALTNGRSLSVAFIAKPPLPEQRAIATALSDVDALLDSLDRLIAKKRDLKQAAMQQLLTGKTRLPGFEGEWEVKQLGSVCSQVTTGKLDANAMSSNGEYRFYTCAKDFYFIDNYAFDCEALLISGNGANVGYIHYYEGKFNAYQRTYVLSGFSVSIRYIQHYLSQKLAERIEVEVKAGGTPYITRGTITEMFINLPPSKTEQAAIATVLSDMDVEIAALEQRRNKTKNIKQAMMQELLTGKTRLVTPAKQEQKVEQA